MSEASLPGGSFEVPDETEDRYDFEFLEGLNRPIGRVQPRPTRAAERRQARKQIQADLDELGDLYEPETAVKHGITYITSTYGGEG